MKISVLSLALSLLLFTSCKKDKAADPGLTSMESGVYSGKYISQNGGVIDTRYQFRIAINQINDSTYTVHQVDAGILPDFNMVYGAVLGAGSTTKLKFRIPIQNGGVATIVGDARVTNGYDALYYAFDHSITFGIVFDDDPLNYIRFVGIKE